MKVLHVVREFSPPSESFIYDLLRRLEADPVNSHVVLASRRVGREDRPFRHVVRLAFFDTCLVGATRRRLKQAAIDGIRVVNAGRLRRLLGRLDPDLIHCHFGWAAVAMFRLLGHDLQGRRMLISLHGTDITYSPTQNPGYLEDLRELTNQPNVLFTANSGYIARRAVEVGIPVERVELLYYSVGPHFASVSERAPGRRQFSIINVARFVGWKGQEYLVEAFAMFHRQFPRSSLTLVGDGDTRPSIQQRVRELGIEDAVRFTGVVSHAEVARMLNEASVYVQPSILDETTRQAEGFGLAVLEAIACGLPVIVTDTGGLPEVVGDGPYKDRFFFVVREKSASDIADVLAHLVSGRDTFENNAPYAAERLAVFAPDRQISRLRELYARLMASA